MFRKISASEVSRVVPGGGGGEGGEGTTLVNVNIKATEENDPVHLTSRKPIDVVRYHPGLISPPGGGGGGNSLTWPRQVCLAEQGLV